MSKIRDIPIFPISSTGGGGLPENAEDFLLVPASFSVQANRVTSFKVGRSRSWRLRAYAEMDFSASRIGNESQFFLLSPLFLSVFARGMFISCFSRSYCGLGRCLSKRDGSDDMTVILCSQEFGVCLSGWQANSVGWIHYKQGVLFCHNLLITFLITRQARSSSWEQFFKMSAIISSLWNLCMSSLKQIGVAGLLLEQIFVPMFQSAGTFFLYRCMPSHWGRVGSWRALTPPLGTMWLVGDWTTSAPSIASRLGRVTWGWAGNYQDTMATCRAAGSSMTTRSSPAPETWPGELFII